MKYKKSRYNVAIDHLDDGKILIYNTFSGIFGVMDHDTQILYNDVEKLNIEAVEDQKQKENCVTMIKYGYIVDSELDELAAYKMRRSITRVNSDTLNLTIAPTMACNMQCPYCYESKTGKHMSAEIQKKLIDFVKAQLTVHSEIKRMKVIWYGGEPLLQKNTIYNLTNSFLKLCEQFNISYEAAIVTNGSLLDRETAWKLYNDCAVRKAQITIDGMAELHNKRRILANGAGSFDEIIQNIEACRSFMRIAIRMNIDKTNEGEIQHFLQFAVEQMKWIDNPYVYIAPVDSYTENCSHRASLCFALSEFAHVSNAFQKMNYSINRNRVKHEFFPPRRDVYCTAEQVNNYVIDPEGYFYNCWMQIGQTSQSSGHISKPFLITNKYYKWLSSELPSKCEQCVYLPMCSGGCGYFRVDKNGEPHCTSAYYTYKDTLRLAYQDYLHQKKS